jgi:hypothetical protein
VEPAAGVGRLGESDGGLRLAGQQRQQRNDERFFHDNLKNEQTDIPNPEFTDGSTPDRRRS